MTGPDVTGPDVTGRDVTGSGTTGPGVTGSDVTGSGTTGPGAFGPDAFGQAATGPGARREPLRIGNASGFYGDRFDAVRDMLTGGPLDVLTGDYLAELTMLILGRDRTKDPGRGYAKTFLRQMEECLGLAAERGVKIVTNAGGLNPAGLADALRALADRLGVPVRVAHVEGDDLTGRAEWREGTLTANAYLGGAGIAACLRAGADVVVTGRVTDAALVTGPAAAHHGWAPDDWDALAGAVVAGHVLECGTQATGGNYAFFADHDVRRPGFPLAEIHHDGAAVITKHPGTGGAVTAGTVTAQLLYETAGARYPGPDVTARLDFVRLVQEDRDRVRIEGVRGEAPPPTLKAGLTRLGGWRNEVVFVLTGLGIEAKAQLVRDQMEYALSGGPAHDGDRPGDGPQESEHPDEGTASPKNTAVPKDSAHRETDPPKDSAPPKDTGPRRPAKVTWTLARTDRADAPVQEEASALLRLVVRDPDPDVVGRAVSGAAVELGLASYPGFHLTAPPGKGIPYGVFEAVEVPAGSVEHTAVLPDGSRVTVPPPPATRELAAVQPPPLPDPLPPGPTRRAPLGLVAGARSGDKGGSANLGVWARTDAAWRWLAHALTVQRVRDLLPEVRALPVTRHVLPNLRALNFVVDGLLGDGVASQARFDPQAKALGEWLRARHLEIPEALL